MSRKSLFALILSIALSLLAAGYRFGDSSHAMGLLSQWGGKTLHPFALDSGQERYTLIATATVLPPYRGDARIVLEGLPEMEHAIYDSDPAIDLGLHHHPRLEGDLLRDLRPRDRLALWVVMKPSTASPLPAGHRHQDGPDGPPLDGSAQAPALSFYDSRDNRKLMSFPIRFGDDGGHHGH